MRIEIKSTLEKKIRESHYFYDSPNKRAMMRYLQNNILTRLIYDYELNEIYKIDGKQSIFFYFWVFTLDDLLIDLSENVEAPGDVYDPPDGRPLYRSTCQAYKLTDTPSLNFFGFTLLQPDMPTIGSPEHVIRFYPQVNEHNGM